MNYPTKKGQKFRHKGDIVIFTVASFISRLALDKEFDTLEECQAQSNTGIVTDMIVKNQEYGSFSDLKYTEKA